MIYTPEILISQLRAEGVILERREGGKLFIDGELSDVWLDAVKRFKPQILDILAAPNIKPPTIAVSAYIKRLKSSGVEFHVSPGYFETGGRALRCDERENLQKAAGAILCYLHQAALNHFLFKPFPETLAGFEFEVIERQGIIAETETPDNQTEYLAARQTAYFWFERYFTDGIFHKKNK